MKYKEELYRSHEGYARVPFKLELPWRASDEAAAAHQAKPKRIPNQPIGVQFPKEFDASTAKAIATHMAQSREATPRNVGPCALIPRPNV